MFNTMTITKAAGALIGSLLLLLLVNWAAGSLYTVLTVHHGDAEHAEGEAAPITQAYVIPVEEAAPAEGEAEAETVDVAAVLAAGDAAAGEREWGKCRSCHKLDGTDGVGPHLNGVVNRDKASVGGYAYSQAAQDMPGEWTPDNLFAFIENPKGYMPGTKMSFAGIRQADARANLIAYLATQN